MMQKVSWLCQHLLVWSSYISLAILKAADINPPSYEDAAPDADAIFKGTWDLACTPKPGDRILGLDKEGKPIWENFGPYEDTTEGYRLNGFMVSGKSASSVQVTNSEYTWSCAPGSVASLLHSDGAKLNLKAFGKYLVVFVKMVEPKWGSLQPIPSDLMNALEVKSESQDVFYITGTAIYNVEGDKEGFLVESQKWTRLWAWKQGKPQQAWRISRPGTRLTLTNKYIICRSGQKFTMYSRKNGHDQGSFYIPCPNDFLCRPGLEFGPMASQGGLIFFKTTPETHYIFSIQNGKIYFQLWKAETKVEDPVVLRGSIDNVELEVLGKKPNWTIYRQERKITWPDPVASLLKFFDDVIE